MAGGPILFTRRNYDIITGQSGVSDDARMATITINLIIVKMI
jgi:hypothetical protein